MLVSFVLLSSIPFIFSSPRGPRSATQTCLNLVDNIRRRSPQPARAPWQLVGPYQHTCKDESTMSVLYCGTKTADAQACRLSRVAEPKPRPLHQPNQNGTETEVPCFAEPKPQPLQPADPKRQRLHPAEPKRLHSGFNQNQPPSLYIHLRRWALVSRSRIHLCRHTPAGSAPASPPPRPSPTQNRYRAPTAQSPNPVVALYYFE